MQKIAEPMLRRLLGSWTLATYLQRIRFSFATISPEFICPIMQILTITTHTVGNLFSYNGFCLFKWVHTRRPTMMMMRCARVAKKIISLTGFRGEIVNDLATNDHYNHKQRLTTLMHGAFIGIACWAWLCAGRFRSFWIVGSLLSPKYRIKLEYKAAIGQIFAARAVWVLRPTVKFRWGLFVTMLHICIWLKTIWWIAQIIISRKMGSVEIETRNVIYCRQNY